VHVMTYLAEIGFYSPVKSHILEHRLKRLIARMQLEKEELNILRGILTATMLSAGIPLVRSLEMVTECCEHKKLQQLITDIRHDITRGRLLSDTLKKHHKHFNPLYCSLIKSAEQTGMMDVMLTRIADHLEKTESLKRKIKKALIYPIAIISLTIVVAIILLIFVVPQFQQLFSSYGAKLPAYTRMILSLSSFIQQWWWLVLLALITIIFATKYANQSSSKIRRHVDRMRLKIPVFGSLLKKSIIAQTMRTLSTNLSAGVPLVASLMTVAEVANNTAYHQSLQHVSEKIKTGETLHKALSASRLFPQIVVQMVAVGEESGSLDSMLDKIAVFYEADVEHMVSNLSSLLEPFIMVFLGVIIGGFVLAMYLPIFKLGSIF